MHAASVRGAAFGALVVVGLAAVGLWRGEFARQAESSGLLRASAAPADPSLGATSNPPPSAPARPLALAPPPSSVPEIPLEEADLMVLIRRSKDTDAARCVDLAREGNRRFPDTADAPERASLLIHALATLGRASEARGEAEDMVNRYPDTHWVREIERFTGAHRHRNLRLAEDGGLESY